MTTVSNDPDAFESWGSYGNVADAPLAEHPGRSSAFSVRARRPLVAVLVTAIACAAALLTAELTSVGPFASAQTAPRLASVTPQPPIAHPAPLQLAPGLPGGQWQWQWIATGTPTGQSGSVEVRAWQLSRICNADGSCHLEFARQLEDPLAPAEGADRTELTRGVGNVTSASYNAQFAPVASACSQGTQTQRAPLTDHFVLEWTAGTQTLWAAEHETWACPFGASFAYVSWTATRVTPPRVPALAPDRQHAPTVRAFRAAARRTCTAMNSAATPLARTIAADEELIHSQAGNAAKARAETSIANELSPLVPLAVQEYTEVPQPPTGALDRVWLHDVSLNRAALPSFVAAFAALRTALEDAADFDRTANAVDQQTELAELSLFENDLVDAAGANVASEHIEQNELHLPAICITQPAISSIFSAPTRMSA